MVDDSNPITSNFYLTQTEIQELRLKKSELVKFAIKEFQKRLKSK